MLVDPESKRPSRVRVEVERDERRRVLARSGKPAPEPA
jgi:hypothetical protein